MSTEPTDLGLGRQENSSGHQDEWQNASRQGERQGQGERQRQQLHAPQLETTPGHLMEDTWGTGTTVQNRSTPPKSAYIA